jgi:hypothetical protein
MKKLQIILLVLGIGFFAYLLWTVGVRELSRELALLGWGLVPLMFGEGAAEMIHTVGWRHCLTGQLRRLPWVTLFRIRMAGYAINYLTPTAALGGEVTKVALLASYERGPGAASGVLIGKVCFALGHVIFVTLGAVLVLWRLPLPESFRMGMLTGGLMLVGGVTAFLLLQKQGKLGAIVRWLATRIPTNKPLQKIAREFSDVDEAMKRFYRERPLDLFFAIGWHLIGYSVGIAQTWLFFHLLHQEVSLIVIAGVWFFGMWCDLLTFAVPLNLGTLEGTRSVVLHAIGFTTLMGVTFGFAIRLAQMAWAGFGLINNGLLASRIKVSPQQQWVRKELCQD